MLARVKAGLWVACAFWVMVLPVAVAEEGAPLLLNGRVLPGVRVVSSSEGVVVRRGALVRALGPVGGLLPGQGDTLRVAEVARVLAASVGRAPAVLPVAATGADVDWWLSRAVDDPVGDLSVPGLMAALDRGLRAFQEHPPTRPMPSGAVALWVKPSVLKVLHGGKSEGRVRLVLTFEDGAPLRWTLRQVSPHRYEIFCLFCEAPPGLAVPDLAGLSQTTVAPVTYGLSISLWLRPAEAPGTQVLSEPARLVVDWPLHYRSVTERQPHRCLTVQTVMEGDEQGWLTYHHAAFQADCPGLRLAVVDASDRLGFARDPVDIARHHRAVLLVNGGYFDDEKLPIGVLRQGGTLLATSHLERSAVMLADGKLVFSRPKAVVDLLYRCGGQQRTLPIARLNRPPRPDGFSLYTTMTHQGYGRDTRRVSFETGTVDAPPFLAVGRDAVWDESRCDGVEVMAEPPGDLITVPPDAVEGVPGGAEIAASGGEAPPSEEEAREGPFGVVGNPAEGNGIEEAAEEGGQAGPMLALAPLAVPAFPAPLVSLSALVPHTPVPVPVSYSVTYFPTGAGAFPDMLQAGPRLVRGGVPRSEAEWEGFKTATGHFGPDPAPRTAVGYDPDTGLVHFLFVVGRHRESRGLTLQETAELMHQLGATQAVNLDGGGSSAMVVNGDPLGKAPLLFTREWRRAVPNALALIPLDQPDLPWHDAGPEGPPLDEDIPPLPESGLPEEPDEEAAPLPLLDPGLTPVEEPQWQGWP